MLGDEHHHLAFALAETEVVLQPIEAVAVPHLFLGLLEDLPDLTMRSTPALQAVLNHRVRVERGMRLRCCREE
jgi:hypothetical protein